MNQKELRERLMGIVNAGLSVRAISRNVDISYDLLAKFKQGRLLLIEKDAKKLDQYLSNVKIPLRQH